MMSNYGYKKNQSRSYLNHLVYVSLGLECGYRHRNQPYKDRVSRQGFVNLAMVFQASQEQRVKFLYLSCVTR